MKGKKLIFLTVGVFLRSALSVYHLGFPEQS